MVDVKGAIDEGGRSTQPLGGLVGRTRGALRLGLRSVLEGSNGLLSGLSSRLGSALSLVTDEDEAESHSKLSGNGYDNEENGIEKEEKVGGQSCSTISDKCNPEIRATGPDPFDKLKVITGELFSVFLNA